MTLRLCGVAEQHLSCDEGGVGRGAADPVSRGGLEDADSKKILKWSAAAGVGAVVPWSLREGGVGGGLIQGRASAAPLAPGLSDPAAQPKFGELAPNALDPAFKYSGGPAYTVDVGLGSTMTGLRNPAGDPVATQIFGYGQGGIYTWPGKTFEVRSGP